MIETINIKKSCLLEKGVTFIEGIKIKRKVNKKGTKLNIPEKKEKTSWILVLTFIIFTLPPLLLLFLSYVNASFGDIKENIYKFIAAVCVWIYVVPIIKRGIIGVKIFLLLFIVVYVLCALKLFMDTLNIALI